VASDVKNVLPGQTTQVKIKVQHADARPAAGAQAILVVVDQALLQMKPNPSWEVFEKFWQARELDVFAGRFSLSKLDILPTWVADSENWFCEIVLGSSMQ